MNYATAINGQHNQNASNTQSGARNPAMLNLAASFDRDYESILNKLAEGRQQARPAPRDLITVNNGKQIFQFSAASIQWVEACGDYIFIHTDEGRSPMIRKTMKAMETLLEEHRFTRIHRSYIVNLDRVSGFYNNQHREKVVELDAGEVLCVSRRFKSKVAKALSH